MKASKPLRALQMIEYLSQYKQTAALGHVRNNLLGYSLARILSAAGNRVVKTNIVNDRGIRSKVTMLAWKKWGGAHSWHFLQDQGRSGRDFYVLFDKHYKAELAKFPVS